MNIRTSLKTLTFLVASNFGFTSFAATCQDVKSCMLLASSLTGEKYILKGDIAAHKIVLSPNLKINRENAVWVFTNILMQHGLTRVPAFEKGHYYIVERDAARESPIPVVEGSLNNPPELPDNFDIVTLKYTMVDKNTASEVQKYIVDLTPRPARTTAYPDSNLLLIIDSAQNIKRLLEVLKTVDKPMSKEFKKELERRRKETAGPEV